MATMSSEDLNLGASTLLPDPVVMEKSQSQEGTSDEVVALLESSRPAVEVDGFVDG